MLVRNFTLIMWDFLKAKGSSELQCGHCFQKTKDRSHEWDMLIGLQNFLNYSAVVECPLPTVSMSSTANEQKLLEWFTLKCNWYGSCLIARYNFIVS